MSVLVYVLLLLSFSVLLFFVHILYLILEEVLFFSLFFYQLLFSPVFESSGLSRDLVQVGVLLKSQDGGHNFVT